MFDDKVQKVIDKVAGLRDQVDDHWQIPGDEALVLAQLVRVGRCRSICEIGHSYGFSTLHLAAAARELGGHMHSFDASRKKHDAAGEHLRQAGLDDTVTLHLGQAQSLLPVLAGETSGFEPFDFVFIDAVKAESMAYLQAVSPLLASTALIATDNTTTHHDELSDFVAHLRGISKGRSCAFPVGNGFELTLLTRD